MSMPSNCSAPEWDARVDLAALYRLAVHYGWTDLTSTHISARISDVLDCYLLNTHDMMFDEITASTLVRMSIATGRIADATRNDTRNINLAGHIIHSNVLAN